MFGWGPLQALGSIGPAAVPTLLNILTNATAPRTRFDTIIALKEAGMNPVPGAVPVLLQYANDENETVAMGAVGMLGNYGAGDPAALAALEQIAQGPRLNLRSTALQALGHFGVQAAPALVRALGDTNDGRAFIAFNTLAYRVPTAITNSAVLALAARRLQSQDDDWQGWAAYALMLIDQQARGSKLGFYQRGLTLPEATNVLRRLAPQLLDAGPAQ
jgi:HEAT repeat protein